MSQWLLAQGLPLNFYQAKYISELESPFKNKYKRDSESFYESNEKFRTKFRLLCLLLAKGKIGKLLDDNDYLYIGQFGNDIERDNESKAQKDMSYILRDLLSELHDKHPYYGDHYIIDYKSWG